MKTNKVSVGQTYGRLYVKAITNETDNDNNIKFLCVCNCDNKEILVSSRNLRRNQTKSCGCLQKEIVSNICKQRKKYNKYNLSGEYGIGYTFKNEEFYFDIEDYDKIKDYCWYIDKRTKYVLTRNTNRKIVCMHRLIMNFPNNIQIDHIDRIRNNNRKYNLRVATNQQNQFNKGISSNNSSGIKGVCWDSSRNKWYAYIIYNNKQISIGRFISLSEAKEAREKAEIKYFADRRAQNLYPNYPQIKEKGSDK